MTKQDVKATRLSSSTIAKLGRDETVTTHILARICQALDCQIADIIEVVDPNKRQTHV
jgi:putative transcriptional regulator